MTWGRRRHSLAVERRETAPRLAVLSMLAAIATLSAVFSGKTLRALEPPSDAAATGSSAGDSAADNSVADDAEAKEDDEASPYQGGLIAEYSAADGSREIQLEESVAFSWGQRPPSHRLPPGPFRARFEGQLQIQQPGVYRLRAFAAGSVQLTVDGKQLLKAASPTAVWMDAEPIELPFGFHPLVIEYERASEPARLALYWEGPQFSLEPVAARWLYHETTKTPDASAQRGAELVRALRCAACHELPDEPAALEAASLAHLGGNVSRRWLIDWLSGASEVRANDAPGAGVRRMPHFGFSPADARAVADALLATSEPLVAAKMPTEPVPPANEKKKKKTDQTPPPALPSVDTGAMLAKTLGCLACHRVGPMGRDGLFGGGNLARVAEKRPADFFERWLADPQSVNVNHRMPVFTLDARELKSLALYLQTLTGPNGNRSEAALSPPDAQHDRGLKLVRSAGCAQCHSLTKVVGVERRPQRTSLTPTALARDAESCLTAPDPAKHRPGYALAAADRAAIRAHLTGVNPKTPSSDPVDGSQLLRENSCLACHARGHAQGIAAQLPNLAEMAPELRDVLPALAPPSLTGVGDKLLDEALLAAIATRAPARQPWLKVRMPRFALSTDEVSRIADHLIETDRIPDRAESSAPPSKASTSPATASDSTIEGAGARLVTADGFGCTSCHAIGKWQPQKVALAAHGADLSEIGARVRPGWFERWVRNPARMQPQMEMPSVQQSVRGVLDGQLDRQLAAVWQVLNRPGFTPPSASALRVLRRANLPGAHERAAVLTDLIEVDGKPLIKPLVVGLPNRHNVLVDLSTNRLAAWWIGDTARQQTRGKSWFWEAGVPQLLDPVKRDDPLNRDGAAPTSELLLVRDTERISPTVRGEFLSEFDRLEVADDGSALFEQRLLFNLADQSHTVHVRQTFAPLASIDGSTSSGFVRKVHVTGIPAGCDVEFLTLPGDAILEGSARAKISGRRGELMVELPAATNLRLEKAARGASLLARANQGGSLDFELICTADVVTDQFTPPPAIDRSVARAPIAVVPGFEGVRLPVTDQPMPTGLAWRPDGTLVVTSLEGRVWLGRDIDGDGVEDLLEPFSDELATPWGAAPVGEAIDVINKYGLLRLTDRDGDGRADRYVLLASGWGHTRDYHDWAVGLPRDGAGNYYISLPCQQDERSEAGAVLRGSVVRLVPREPSADDPRRFTIDPLCGGLRFPQGIALSPAEDLFVTDNQGNYTPFNELNHVVRGARYGFINKLESKRGLAPPFRPASVEIPHPWTRSVNGICFLHSPAKAVERDGRDPFGPFAGHLVGCEYDTRRLVRMSLERVAGDFQGAVYPMSRDPVAGEETFEGPLSCAVAPDGALYVGNIRDSGWGAGSNTGSLVRLVPRDLPPGIAEVRLARDGFEIHFTQPVDRQRATNLANFTLASYRRTPTPNYGGPDQDRRVEKVRGVELSGDARLAHVTLEDLREGFVYEIRLRNLVAGREFFPAEAYYTLRRKLPAEVAAPTGKVN